MSNNKWSEERFVNPKSEDEHPEEPTINPLDAEDNKNDESQDQEPTAPEESLIEPSHDSEQVVKLEQQITRLEEDLAKQSKQNLATLAEMENLRRRTKREIEDAFSFGNKKLITALLPVIDSLEHCLAANEQQQDQDNGHAEGVALTHKMFLETLEKFGVTVVNPKDEPFNADYHEAVSTQAVEGVAPQTVVQVLQKGYLLNGRLLRAAMVVVAS